MTRSRSNNAPPILIPVAPTRTTRVRGSSRASTQEPTPANDVESEGGLLKIDDTLERGRASASRTTSRASSVVSSAASRDLSIYSALPPSSPIPIAAQQSTLAAAFQNDGFLRHHHGPPPPAPRPPPRSQQTIAVPPPPIELPEYKVPSRESSLSVEDADHVARQPTSIVSAQESESKTGSVSPEALEERTPVSAHDADTPHLPSHQSSQSDPPNPASNPVDNATDADDADAPESTTPTVIQTLASPTTVLTTPVTRSHCRYHKISMPRVIDGSRMFFAVPGCSLSNTDLMRKQDIKDEGDLTYDEIQRLLTDVESLDLDQNLVGLVRQLVGGDLEREAFYLPLPGERLRTRSSRKKPRASNVESISARNGLSRARGASNAAKYSPTASTSASPARSRVSIASTLTRDSVSDDEDDEESLPKTKRRRYAKKPSVEPESATQGTSEKSEGSKPSRKRQPTRSAAADAAPYDPKNDSNGEDSEHSAQSPVTAKPAAPARKSKKQLKGKAPKGHVPSNLGDDINGQDPNPPEDKGKTQQKGRPKGIKRSRADDDAQGSKKPKKQKV